MDKSDKRLLVVDDEPDFASFVAKVAESIGYDVTITNRPRNFREIYERTEPTDIMLDVIMPETDGIEIIKWLADHQNTARVIVVTGHSPQYANAAKSFGEVVGNFPVKVISKPIGVDDLSAALTSIAD